MNDLNINKSHLETSKISKKDTSRANKVSVEHCNEWVKNNTQKIINLYLRSLLDLKKKEIQKSLNKLAQTERLQNPSKFMRPESLESLKQLTRLNQMSFSDWKQESNITSSKVNSISKKIQPIQFESIDQFLNRGGEIKKVKNSRKKGF
jgi:hypothetical protein